MLGKELIKSHTGSFTIKGGLLGKKTIESTLSLYTDYIEGTGALLADGKLSQTKYKVPYLDILSLGLQAVSGSYCLCIDYKNPDYNSADRYSKSTISLLIPSLSDLEAAKDDVEKNMQAARIRYNEVQAEIKKKEEEMQAFLDEKYNEHVKNVKDNIFEIKKSNVDFSYIAIDKNGDTTIFAANARIMDYRETKISKDDIHYFKLNTEGDSCILNYRDTELNDYRDIFLPSFAMDFLKNNYKDKSYDIVSKLEMEAELARLAEIERQEEAKRQAELERQAEMKRQAEAKRQAELERQAEMKRQAEAKRQAELERQAEMKRQAEEAKRAATAESSSEEPNAEIFEKRVKKLKVMYDNGLLTEEEFKQEKLRLLSEI